MSTSTGSTQVITETLAGFTAGIVTTAVVHPLDLIKTRLQVDRTNHSRLGTSINVARWIVRDEGGPRALYRGLAPNLIGNSLSWALYFLWYDQLKRGLSVYRGGGSTLNYYDYFLASGVAGLLTAVITNPIWVIKTRMLSTASKHPGAYVTSGEGARRIYGTDGIKGFYRGLVPSLFGVSHGALQFMAYEQMKNLRGFGSLGEPSQPSNLDFLLFSGLSKIFAGTIAYPYQVIRSRLQTYDADKSYKGSWDVVGQIWRREGLGGFYKGLGLNLIRVVPSSCVTFLVYENTKLYLSRAVT